MTETNAAPSSPEFNESDLLALLANAAPHALRANPYPLYRRLQQTRPFLWHPIGFWIATGHGDCEAILRDRRFRTVDPYAWQGDLLEAQAPQETRLVQHVLRNTMLFAPDADHARLRLPLNRGFSPRVIEQRRTRAFEVAAQLIRQWPRSGSFDFVQHFASAYPIYVLADVLGVPPHEQERIARWSMTTSPLLDPLQRREAIVEAAKSITEYSEYLRGLIRERIRHPEDDLLSLMVQPAAGIEAATEDELVSNLGFLLSAGHETTMNAIASGLQILLTDPHLRHRIDNDRSRLPGMVHEVLRMEAPVQITMRQATQDVLVGRRLVQAGKRVLLVLGAANRDPSVFADPDRFDETRQPNPHLSFSAGAHYCLGASLATMEMEQAFAALLDLAADLQLVGHPTEWRQSVSLRGPSRLLVRRGLDAQG